LFRHNVLAATLALALRNVRELHGQQWCGGRLDGKLLPRLQLRQLAFLRADDGGYAWIVLD